MKIAITGSGGLLGSCILRVAKGQGHQVVPIHFSIADAGKPLDSVMTCLADIRDCDFIINCAGSKSPQQAFDFYLNAKVPKIIEDYIYHQKLSCKLIHISSINVVIDSLEDKYTRSKRQGEWSLNRLSTTIIRPGLLWSPNKDPLLMRVSAYFGHPFILKFMFKPGNTYSPINPTTLANFIVNELTELGAPPRVINVLGDRKYTLWALMKQLAKKSNSRLIPIPTILFGFIPWHWVIKHLDMGEIFNQMLTVDRTRVPFEKNELLVSLPFNDQDI